MKITIDWIDVAKHPYLCHEKNYKKHYLPRNVEYIPIHYTANEEDTAAANARYFTQPVKRMNKKGQLVYYPSSAHFFVDEVDFYQSLPLKDIAYQVGADKYYHSKCRNSNSIGIEMCTSGNYKVSDKTKNRTAGLVAYLFILFGWTADEVDTRVLRHWDVTRKMCPAQMCGTGNAEWLEFKNLIRQKIAAATAPKETPQISALIFDPVFYGNRYSDLKDAGLTTDLALTEHFIMFGMNELRQGCEGFDPHVYKEYNEDLRIAFGDNNPMYYQHYVNYGYEEKRVHV